tara:strand:- start:46 stop:417 length:372 start_codon:yes stop_codon:yes gene_type:complete
MKLETVRIVSEFLENSWGRESSKDGTYSIKYSLAQNLLTLKYTTLVNFVSESALQPQIAGAAEQAVQLCDSKIAELKKSFKSTTGEALKLEDKGGSDSFELISPVGPKKVAYYRYNHSFSIQD